jgi:hypothetical protein
MCFFELVNDTLSRFFSSSRGLRQGDPLSPFLFLIVMEALSKKISAIENGGYYQASRWDLGVEVPSTFFIFCFANDTLFFCEANPNHLRSLRSLFLCFEVVSGLMINMAKLELVLVGDVTNVEGMGNILGCRVFPLPMKYLDLHLGALFKAKSIWDDIIEKIEHCLAGWKMMYLLKELP